MSAEIRVLPSAEALAVAAAEHIAETAIRACNESGRFVIALSGGSTPRPTYQRLAEEPIASSIPWACTQMIWGDERCVPPQDPASNFRMARESLLDHVPLPAANVHRIRGEDSPEQSAIAYESVLRTVLGTPTGPPRTSVDGRIDLVLLGLGSDGHTASLFPGSSTLHESARWALAARSDTVPEWRVTLTPALLNTAAEIVFLVSGAGKADVLARVLEGPRLPEELPAQVISPIEGRLRWFVDAEAASKLSQRTDATGG